MAATAVVTTVAAIIAAIRTVGTLDSIGGQDLRKTLPCSCALCGRR